MGNIVDFVEEHSVARGFSGQAGAEAAREGAASQAQASREGLALLRGDLDPFRQLGAEQIAGAQALASDPNAQQALLQASPEFQQLQSLSTDPQSQINFLQDNPLFSSLREQASADIFANQAARGKLGSTGTEEALQSSFLQLGSDLINQQIGRTQGAITSGQGLINEQLNRQLPLLNIGQASAAQTGVSSLDALTGIGNVQAAGGIGAANAQAQGAQNIAGLGAAIFASDETLKANVKKVKVHTDDNGLETISYTWDWNDEGERHGLKGSGYGHIAQELQKTHPHLVKEIDGILMVDYSTDETVRPQLWQ